MRRILFVILLWTHVAQRSSPALIPTCEPVQRPTPEATVRAFGDAVKKRDTRGMARLVIGGYGNFDYSAIEAASPWFGMQYKQLSVGSIRA